MTKKDPKKPEYYQDYLELDKILNSLYVDWSLKFIRDSYNPIKLVFLLSI